MTRAFGQVLDIHRREVGRPSLIQVESAENDKENLVAELNHCKTEVGNRSATAWVSEGSAGGFESSLL